MTINLDLVYVLNVLLCVIIITVALMVYRSNRIQVALYIAIAFFLYGISHAMYILGLNENYDNLLIVLRIIGYLTIILGLYISWKLVKTQLQILSEKNGQLEKEIAEKKHHQELREQAEEKYHIVFDNALVAMSIVDEDLLITFSNSECEHILGFSREETVGKKRVIEFLHPDDVALVFKYQAMRKMSPASTPDRYEVRMITKDGSVKNVLLNVAIIPGSKKIVASFLDITERKQAEDRLKASLAEKEVLVKEVHHRVKNNLQIISSLLSLQADKILDSRDVDLFKESQSRVKSMALIHEKLYRSRDLNEINLEEYAVDIVVNLSTTFGVQEDMIKTTVDMPNLSINLDKGIPCGLIITELVTNCYKHAFPDGRRGEVLVSMRIDAGNYVLTVADNGVGLPEGFEVDKLTSLGIQLVSTLSGQLNGTISITADHGTSFKLIFPQ